MTAHPVSAQELVAWAEMYGDPEDWAKRAQAAHARAERLEGELAAAEARAAEAERATELLWQILEAFGWGGTLRIGYEGQAGAVEELEEALHDALSLLTPKYPQD